MKRLFLLIFFLYAFALTGSAAVTKQDSLARITGIVRQENAAADAAGLDLPIGGCVIQLFYDKNGKLDSLYTTSSPSEGRFSFRNVPVQRVALRLQCLGYETLSGVYELGPGDNVFLLTMKETSEELREAKVVAEVPLMTRLRDTTIFNTQAVRSMSGDGLRDVLEQIPGFSISDAGIFVNGVKVSRTYVNGLLVFGDEAMNAVSSLRADEVTQVKVYDEQSAIDKHRGRINSRKERVLNVITKDRFLSLAQLGVAGGGGVDSSPQGRYSASAAAAYDSQMLNVSACILADNIGRAQDNFYSPSTISSYVDLKSRNPLTSYTRQEQASLFFAKHWKNRTFGNSLRGNYSYSHLYCRSSSKAITDYFMTESSPAMSQLDSTYGANSAMEHDFGLTLNMLDTPLKSFVISMGGKLSGRSADDLNISSKSTGSVQTFGRNESFSSKDRSWSVDGKVHWTDNDVVRWRPEADVETDFGRNTQLSWSVDTLASSFLRRQLSSDGFGNNAHISSRAGVSASLLNDRRRSFDLGLFATVDYMRRHSRQMTLDEWDVPEPVTDIANSYDFTRNEMTASAAVEIDYSSSKDANVKGNVSVNRKTLLNDESYPADFSSHKNFIYPEFAFDLKLRDWDISSSMKAISPSVEQISNRVCDANPLVLTGGNPDLGQSYLINAWMFYRPEIKSRKGGTVRSLTLRPSASITANPIVRRVMYFNKDTILDGWDGYEAKAGSALYTYGNASRPSWNIGATGEYSLSLRYNMYSLRFTMSSNYAQSSQFSGNDQIWIGDWSSRMNIAFMYNPSRRLRIIERPGVAYIQSNDNDGVNLSSRLVYSNALSASWDIIQKRLRLECNYGFSGYDYVSGMGKDTFTHTLNAELSIRLLKDSPLRLSLQALDLLNSGSVYSSAVNASYMSQSWKTTYGRYFLLNISYVFRKKK